MKVERLYLAAEQGAPQIEQASIRVVAGAGIEGDRYFGRRDEPGQNLTLIEIEEIEAFFSEQGREPDLSITRRNVLTRGVRLNALVGTEFLVGEVRLRGVELCEPCRIMGAALSFPGFSSAEVVKRFLQRGGLRAEVLSSGQIQRGAALTLLSPAPD